LFRSASQRQNAIDQFDVVRRRTNKRCAIRRFSFLRFGVRFIFCNLVSFVLHATTHCGMSATFESIVSLLINTQSTVRRLIISLCIFSAQRQQTEAMLVHVTTSPASTACALGCVDDELPHGHSTAPHETRRRRDSSRQRRRRRRPWHLVVTHPVRRRAAPAINVRRQLDSACSRVCDATSTPLKLRRRPVRFLACTSKGYF